MKKAIKVIFAFCLIVTLLASTTHVSAATYLPGYYKVAYQSMNVRSGPGLSYPVVDIVYKDTIVIILDITTDSTGKVWGVTYWGGEIACFRVDSGYMIYLGDYPY